TAEAEIGKVYTGKVERIVDFGAFVSILPGKDGLVHISQIANQRIEKVTDVLQEGQEVKVLVLDVDNRGRIKLSMKDVEASEHSGVCYRPLQPANEQPGAARPRVFLCLYLSPVRARPSGPTPMAVPQRAPAPAAAPGRRPRACRPAACGGPARPRRDPCRRRCGWPVLRPVRCRQPVRRGPAPGASGRRRQASVSRAPRHLR